jgi:hypothetical protein
MIGKTYCRAFIVGYDGSAVNNNLPNWMKTSSLYKDITRAHAAFWSSNLQAVSPPNGAIYKCLLAQAATCNIQQHTMLSRCIPIRRDGS